MHYDQTKLITVWYWSNCITVKNIGSILLFGSFHAHPLWNRPFQMSCFFIDRHRNQKLFHYYADLYEGHPLLPLFIKNQRFVRSIFGFMALWFFGFGNHLSMVAWRRHNQNKEFKKMFAMVYCSQTLYVQLASMCICSDNRTIIWLAK